MKIYNKNNTEIHDIAVDDSSVRYRSIMTDDSLTLNFSLTGAITIPQFSYVNFEGQRYTLWRPQEFKKHNTRNHEYTLTLHGYREFLKFVKYKDTSAKPYRLKFSLTAKPAVFLKQLVDCLNLKDSGWTMGDCIDAPEKTLSFNHEFCIDVLGRMSQEWNTEFEFEGKKVHFRKVEKFKDAPLALSYGKGKGFLPGVGRYNESDKQPIGSLHVIGGERNIDFSKYGSRSLLLPKSAMLVYEGKTYRTDEDGMFITRDGNNLVGEDSYDGAHFYPHRVGTVSEVIVVDAEKHFYDIKDSSIPEALNYRDCRIKGEKAVIKFESGALAGREFDIEQTDSDLTGYIHAERRFKIVPAEVDGVVMPSGAFAPKVGDKYAIFNINLPQAYISDDATKSGASWEMFREAVRYFAENETDKFRFTGELDGVWSKSKWLEIGGKIVPGGHVLFSDEQFQPQGVVIRIVAVKDYVNKPHKPEITLSNAPISGSFSSGLAKLEADEVVIEESKKEVLRFSKRQWRDIRETTDLLEKAMLNFSGSINPLTIETMQLIAGDESLQFRFVNSKTNPTRVDKTPVFNKQDKKLSITAGILQHMTLGITTLTNAHKPAEYRYWDLGAYTSPPLTSEKPYYLYARCAKLGSTAVFLLSETAIAMEAVSGQYHFLIGILNSENLGERSFASLYGYTEITPGRVVTNRIESEDGGTFFDLVNGIIGGKIRFIATGGTETNLADWADGAAQDIQAAQGAANAAVLAAQQAIDDAAANVGLINTEVGKLQAQIDGEVSNWFYPYSPTLANYPASDWTTNAIKDRHVGDTFTNTAQAPATDAGKSWRFVKNGTVYSWTQIADSDAVLALQKAAQAQSTADGKSTTYLIQPSSYKFGDMWVLNADRTVNGVAYKQGEILTATQDSAVFAEAHWMKRVRYTDDTAVENLEIGGRNYFLGGSTVRNGSIFLELKTGHLSELVGKKVVVSFDIKSSNGAAYNVYPYQNNGVSITGTRHIATTTEYRRVSFSETIKDWGIVHPAYTTGGIGIYNANGAGLSVKNVKIEIGNKATDYSEAPEDIQARITEAKQEALTAAGAAQSSANSANQAVGNLNNYVDGAFKDGLIDSSEAKAIEKYINVVNSEKAGLEATYNKLYANTYLEGSAKTALLNAKITYFGAVDNLLAAINSAIADGKTTVAEKQNVDAKYSSYKIALSSLQSAIEEANKAIQDRLNKNAINLVTIKDTRNNNQPPSWYFTNYSRMTVWEFKTCSVIGIAGEGIYCELETKVKWADTTGGSIVQVATVNSGKQYRRYSSGTTTWTVWENLDVKIDDAKLTAEQAQLAADGYMRARYIRDWCAGNTTNNWNGWNEIKVVLKNGTNIALGKPVTGGVPSLPSTPYSLITDGNTTNYANTPPQTPPQAGWVRIDLGQIYYDIDYIQVWHYWQDGRTYFGTKTEISVDGVNWTPVFDSAKSGTYKETEAGKIHTFRPHEVTAKVNRAAAVTDKFGTTASGGLISTVMILLRELNSVIETAGVSGIQSDGYLPAYWSGGTYAEAVAFGELMRAVDRNDNPIASATLNAKMSSIAMLHNGHAKVGELIIKSNGQIIILDKATGKVKFVINSQAIPPISDLLTGTQFGSSVENTTSFTSTEKMLPNTITVNKNNSRISFSTASVQLTTEIYDSSRVSFHLNLLRNGEYYANITGLLATSTRQTVTQDNINISFTGCPTGVYSVQLIISVIGTAYSNIGDISASTLSWNFTQSDVRYFQLGLDGLMAFYSDNHFHYTETGGLDVRGATNMPGVLAAGSSTSGGIQSNVWGAKSSTANITPITGGFRVPLSGLSHSNYVVQITPHTNTTFRVGTKTSTYFEVYGTGGFDYVVIGNNYA